MSLYFVGIDISKYKHDCCIISAVDQKVVSKFTVKNDKAGFEHLLTIFQSLSSPEYIRIGFESTAHYALNLELFLENAHHSFMEVNPVLIKEYKKSTSLRRTKTDSVDCESIARWLMTVAYKPHSKGFYHAYSLKSLTRLRDRLIRQRSFYLVKMTNFLDHTFPEFKPFFNERLSKTALYLLENYGTAEKMAKMNSASYDKLRCISRGKFSPGQFLQLKGLAVNTVGVNNSIFDVELNSLLTLYKVLAKEIGTLEEEINKLIEEVHPHYMSVPGIGPISAAVIYSEYGDMSNFSNSGQMLAFAGIEPGINESGTASHGGRMVKRGSSQLRYVLINCCLPLIRFDMTFATYYAKKRGEGKPHRVAITHVAKKLVRVIYALERQDVDYSVQKLR
ncbi:IS110 family transposase [Anaerocolumna cellulosilytica]|uniref:IS110 family transposase n=1 Tax=Anaerocolumna cellulosilytica TaxID=433286 RepID=A0A6S6QV87_9FIRM|nr:IS110 family transposase [Anaerocolumna cellulosilytica]MBB5196101.1 transposase [Anaerocolumna cellulosilytica]BCJ93596.1 IS110 family transposase [Anaerocolumna cellulosilytica]